MNKVNPQTVQVGDRVQYGKVRGTVIAVSESSRKYGYGSIKWDDEPLPTESCMMNWTQLTKV